MVQSTVHPLTKLSHKRIAGETPCQSGQSNEAMKKYHEELVQGPRS